MRFKNFKRAVIGSLAMFVFLVGCGLTVAADQERKDLDARVTALEQEVVLLKLAIQQLSGSSKELAKKEPAKPKRPNRPERDKVPFIKYAQIVADYNANPVSAMRTYGDKWWAVGGWIFDIDKDHLTIRDAPRAQSGSRLSSIYFEPDQLGVVEKLSDSDIVVVIGYLAAGDVDDYPTFKFCEFVDPQSKLGQK